MKKLYLSLIVLFSHFISFGQGTETEPNNDFPGANELPYVDEVTGALGNGDTIDLYRLPFQWNGIITIYLEVTNTGTVTSLLDLNMYNSLQINNEYVGNFLSQGYQMYPGSTFYDTITLCGQAADEYFMKLESQGDFGYKVKWYPTNIGNNDGYNDLLIYATPFYYDQYTDGGVGHKFWGNDGYDPLDYYASIVPAGNYDSIRLSLRAINNSCANGKWLKYYVYRNDESTLIDSGYVGSASVNAFQEVFANVSLAGMQPGDKLILKLVSSGAFKYEFRYHKVDEFEPDAEDNCCTYSAIPVVENEIKTGNVGEYDYNNGEWIDEYDTYRIILPQDGAFSVFVKGRNDECSNYDNALNCEVLDKYGNTFYSQRLLYWDNYPACGEYRTDSIKFRGFASDTFYLRLNAWEKLSYSFHYELKDSTGSDPGESYNLPVTTVLPISAGEVKKGHLRFSKTVNRPDGSDIYQANLPVDGNVRLYIKSTFRDSYDGPNNGNGARLTVSSSNFTGRVPSNPPVASFTPDGTYYDTLNICGAGAGPLYFTLSSGLAYEYEFRYEIADTNSLQMDVEPNNIFAQAILTPGGVTKKGHIGYVANTVRDQYDFYKMIFTHDDTLKINMQGTNASCRGGNRISFYGYDKNHQAIFSGTMGNNSNVEAGETVYDSIKRFIVAPDTIYFEIIGFDAFDYRFTTNHRLPTSQFTISGDSSVCYGTEIYKAHNILDSVTYHWSLPDGGGTIAWTDSIATVQWNSSGIKKVQLYLSNPAGVSATKQFKVVVHAAAPAAVPVVFNFARTLSTNSIPVGSVCQWYKDAVAVAGANDSSYYAADSGTYTVRFINGCGTGPVSNAVYFAAAAQAQTITFPHTTPVTMSPTARFRQAATASSGLTVFYQKISGPATIVNDSVFITGAGIIIIKAVQPGDDAYRAAAPKYDTIAVIKGNQAISFPAIPNQVYSAAPVALEAVSSAGQPIAYSIVAGNASAGYNSLTLTGAGMVTVRASQPGNADYNAAAPVERTFCTGVRTLTPITGQPNPCLATYTYTTQKIPGANFVWTLSSGGSLTTHNDTAFVQWQTAGNHILKVKANSNCDALYSNEITLAIATSSNAPAMVTNMLPANNAADQQLPLQLSWIPGANTVNYDLYVWDAALAQPATPYATNINNVAYTLPLNSLAYNKTYKWRVIAKNPCSQTAGPVQQFSVVPLADLVLSEIQAPAAANSGQTITITWKVTNAGPGRTGTGKAWNDAVFLSFDTMPNFVRPPELRGPSWSSTTIPVRPLLLGTKPNVTALESGQHYTNSISYTLPASYSQPLYVYVIADYNTDRNVSPMQLTRTNDTARAPNTINVSLSPTPDLRVDTVLAPGAVFSGSTISISYKVKNYGTITPAGAAWADAVYMSQNPLFDKANAIRINAPKLNGTYYGNAPTAGSYNTTQLRTDSTYTRSISAVVPNFIFGTWFVYVVANEEELLYEGALANNNANNTQLQVYLTPTPKLTISNLSVPVTEASTTQPVGINWNILNEGLTDNIEKNKGRYPQGDGNCGCIRTGPNTVSCISRYRDSTAQGSSYWVDKVYLSTDSVNFNPATSLFLTEVKHGEKNSGLFVPDELVHCEGYASPYNVSNVIKPGSNFAGAYNFSIPSDLQPGKYFVYVVANANKDVFEYPGILQVKRSSFSIDIKRPDVIVASVAAPATVSGGQPFAIEYNILNNGAGTVFNHPRRDNIYVSSFPSFDASAQLIATKSYSSTLPPGTPVPFSATYTFPAAASGARYFYVHTNFDSSFRETNSTNNLSAASSGTIVSAATPADLVVSNIQLADTVSTIFSRSLIYTVTNNGSGATFGSWTDSLYISCNPVFSTSNAYVVAGKNHSGIVPAGGSYTDTVIFSIANMSFDINACFPRSAASTGFFFMKANASNGVYEGTNGNNNTRGSGSRTVLNPLVDHAVTNVTGADAGTVARPYTVGWKLTNLGENPNVQGNWFYYHQYREVIFFSPDSVYNGNAVQAESINRTERLNKYQSVIKNQSITIPNVPTGDYYLLVRNNSGDDIRGELNLGNNTNLLRDAGGMAKKIHIERPLLPDLTDSIIMNPPTVASGQPIQVIRRITNRGAGASYPSNMTNNIWLSTDFDLSSYQDVFLSSKPQSRTLQPGQYFDDTVTMTVPAYVSQGNYILIGKANSTGSVFESNHENNYSYGLITVYNPPETDLVVDKVWVPDTVYLGYTIDTAEWTVQNISPNPARGISSDGIYLSRANTLDSTAVLLGINKRTLDLAPLAEDTVRLAPLVTGVIEGSYNLFVKADLLNNLPEPDKTNNTGMSAAPVFVKVAALPMNVLTSNTLHRTARYYKLNIPDSLFGSTIRISLKTNDSLALRNEMFVASRYIPSASKFDYRFEIPNYGNQQIILTSVTDTVYYIAFNCVSPNPPVQHITIKAEKLPFALLSVYASSGGNTGNVTVKLSGSLFSDSMAAKLSNGSTVINASAVYLTNSTTAYATFNLQGKPLGVYDVMLAKPDNNMAVLPSSFSIVPPNNGGIITGGGVNTGAGNGNEPGCDPGAASGLNSQLVVQMVIPEKVVTNWPFIIQVNYNNPTNVDIPAQSRTIYSDGLKMALTAAGVGAGSTSLYLELTEPGGPPGIIRAGGSGTVTIYTKSPVAVPVPATVLFKLK